MVRLGMISSITKYIFKESNAFRICVYEERQKDDVVIEIHCKRLG